jgi:sialate O-acetylesterase
MAQEEWKMVAVPGRIVAGLLLAGAVLAVRCAAAVSLPTVFGDHMVLQRGEPIPVWGWAEPGETVQVSLDQATVEATTDAAGAWRVALPARAEGGPFELTVKGKTAVTLTDVLVGEVWLCSGQSNMQFTVRSALNFEQEKAAATLPRIRHLGVPQSPASLPGKDVKACAWSVCSPETVGNFSAVAYFFGREISRELNVPVGLINSSWGGTLIEPWTPLCGFQQVPSLSGITDRVVLTLPSSAAHKRELAAQLGVVGGWLAEARKALAAQQVVTPGPEFPKGLLPLQSHQDPTTLYNGMIQGLVPFAFRGALWYQGESNHGDGMLYADKMKALIGGWREMWSKPGMPFYFVQIAPFEYGQEAYDVLPRLWEAQAAAAAIPGVGMAVIHDVGNTKDIHPANKQVVGSRLARLALARTYGRQQLEDSGPVYRAMRLDGSQIRLEFDHVGSGLAARDEKPLNGFELIDADGEDFVAAEARIEGTAVVVSASAAPRPVAVRFAWHKVAEPNLMNKEGLPAWPFRAGAVPRIDYLSREVAEAKDFELLYDLDLKTIGRDIRYNVDRSGDIKGAFDRVAYMLELRRAGERTRYVYASMDAFTDDLRKLGVPTLSSKAYFQQMVKALNVVSNADGMVTGVGLTGGVIEFWPNNYSPLNTLPVANASGELWDFGDQPVEPKDGHGSMQVGNAEAKQTLFALNAWNAGPGADLGIGNSPATPVVVGGNAMVERTRDWTFQSNASRYTAARLRVLVRLRKG